MSAAAAMAQGLRSAERVPQRRRAIELLVLRIEDHRFAVAAADVIEVCRSAAVVPLAKAPSVVEGVMNLRGVAVTVLNLRRRFGLPERPPALSDHLVVALAEDRCIALRVDRALELVTLNPDQLEPRDRVAPTTPFLAGVAKLPDGLLLIHDLGEFLTAAEAQVLDSIELEACA